jgi:hypothetical protein
MHSAKTPGEFSGNRYYIHERVHPLRVRPTFRDFFWLALATALALGWLFHMRQFTWQCEVISRELVIADETVSYWRYSEEQIERALANPNNRFGNSADYKQRLDRAIAYQEAILQKLQQQAASLRRGN